eukprot:TRINITY_DN12598_c0_g1_i1.p1 TRINITY_DN12598_c0_g1~~TRINITY_DN12598_c0_g1_i1.p1  ORF type:complete len:279 (+),score=23.26 TRINITY_DN12598_c0_g1_i1:161-997(+)
MYSYTRRYNGPLQAVIMDLAGTCVDFGSLAPIHAFLELFESEGIPVSEEEARGPMGTEKREHIRQLLALPRILNRWIEQHGAVPGESDIDHLYRAFLPLQTRAIKRRTQLVPGALELQRALRDRGIALGVNTGYSREMVEAMLPALESQGFEPASVVCATEVPRGRPAPYMSFRNAVELGVECVQACVKVDDTATGIEEGLNAGMWTVAVVASGNALGLSEEAFAQLDADERAQRLVRGRDSMARTGAHFVIDTIRELPEVIDQIEELLMAPSFLSGS